MSMSKPLLVHLLLNHLKITIFSLFFAIATQEWRNVYYIVEKHPGGELTKERNIQLQFFLVITIVMYANDKT